MSTFLLPLFYAYRGVISGSIHLIKGLCLYVLRPIFLNSEFPPRGSPVVEEESTDACEVPGSSSHASGEWGEDDDLDGQKNGKRDSRDRLRLGQSARMACASTFG